MMTLVNRLSRIIHFLRKNSTAKAVNAENSFFENIFKHHGLFDNILPDRDPKLQNFANI